MTTYLISTEEQYFGHSAYTNTAKHMEVHRNFVDRITTVETQLRLGRLTVGDDLLHFLKDWLLNHIRVTDHQYVPFVKQLLAGKQMLARAVTSSGSTPQTHLQRQ